jgi:hypothetical protein
MRQDPDDHHQTQHPRREDPNQGGEILLMKLMECNKDWRIEQASPNYKIKQSGLSLYEAKEKELC